MYEHDVEAKEPQNLSNKMVLVHSLQHFDAEISGWNSIIYATHRELVCLMILWLKIYGLVCAAHK